MKYLRRTLQTGIGNNLNRYELKRPNLNPFKVESAIMDKHNGCQKVQL